MSYVRCAFCGRHIRRPRSKQCCPTTYCSRVCCWRAMGLLRQYLADGRFEQYLATELAQSRAAHREEVRKGLEALSQGFGPPQ